MSIESQVANARAGKEPALVCRVSSGWVVLANMQFLRGYSILLPDPVVSSLNALKPAQREAYLCDMVLVGDALLEVTGAYRINYAIMGNSDPMLHAHIIPRYLDEPEEYRKGQPWSYSSEVLEGRIFNPIADQELLTRLCEAIQKRM